MIVETVLKLLPPIINFEGISFQFGIFKNGKDELRICYKILGVYYTSNHFNDYNKFRGWYNPFYGSKKKFCDFLYLVENISNDQQLLDAINECHAFLLLNNLSTEKEC